MTTSYSASRRRPQATKKSEKTRQQIIEAAIRAIAKWGYQGATLAVIAKEAGLSQGPRQYYFPDKVDLMVAVREKIQEFARVNIDQLELDKEDPKTALRLVLDEEIQRGKSDEYIVDLELKIAIRGAPELRDGLAGLINTYEQATDEWWLALFSSTGRSREDLLAARYMSTWLLRGLAIERISRTDEVTVARMEQHLIDTVYGLIFGA